MNGEKDAMKSKGFLGLVALVLLWANSQFDLGLGDVIGNDPEQAMMWLAAVIAAWGRLTAKTRITSFFGWKFVKEEVKE